MSLFKSPSWDVDFSSEILNTKLFGGSKKRKVHDRPTEGQESAKKLKSQRKFRNYESSCNLQNTSLAQDEKFDKSDKRKSLVHISLSREKHKRKKVTNSMRTTVEPLSPQNTEVSKVIKKEKAKGIQHGMGVGVPSSKKTPPSKKYNALSSLKSRFKSKKKNKFTLPIKESNSAAGVKSGTYQPIRDCTSTPHLHVLAQSSKHTVSQGFNSKPKKAKKRCNKVAGIVSNDVSPHGLKPVLEDDQLKGSINRTNELHKLTNKDKTKLKHQPFANSGHIIQEDLKMPTRRNPGTLRERMLKRLQASRFRYLNQQMYCSQGREALEYFQTDPGAFHAYHHGYRQQLAKWPLNPLNTIINSLKKKSSELIIADFGCGDAQLARSLPNTVHSFDLVALSEEVTVCDMAHTPLGDSSVDVTVFCLSLMGTNLTDYLIEANRILKMKGIMKVAEVESRFEDVTGFIKSLMKYGFTIIHKDLSHNLFYFMDFQKVDTIKKKKKSLLPPVSLKPCLYKKR